MKTVLFVCVENACRSQMAEALFNHLAPDGWRAMSAGGKPAKDIDDNVVLVMKELGIDLGGQHPKLLTREMLKEAHSVVTMGCEGACPATSKPVEDWQIADPRGKPLEDFRKCREEIKQKVLKLIRELKG